jgi:hypothetical protein
MLYGMGQAALQHVGLPTDYDIQRSNFNQALQAGQLAVQQTHQQLLQQAQQYQETLATVPTPWGPVQVPQKDLGKYQTGIAGYYGRTGAAQIAAGARMALGEMQQAVSQGKVARVLPGQDENGNPVMIAYNAYNQPLGNVPGASLPYSFLTKTSNTVDIRDNGLGGFEFLPKTTTTGVQMQGAGIGPAANVIPPGTPAARTLGVGGARATAQPAVPGRGTAAAPAGGAPLAPAGAPTSPSATRWMTWTEPDGRQVAGSALEAAQARVADPTIYPTVLQGSEVKDLMNARQNYRNLTKVGDPAKPETMGVLQLIDSLDKDGQLGPAISRWNQFLTTGVGTSPNDDPRIITLLDKAHLGATGAMLAHFGASGGRSPQMLQQFLKMMNAGTMDAPTLRAGTRAIADYMGDRAMVPTPRGTQPPRGAPPPGAPSSGTDLFKKYGGTVITQ